MRNIERATAIPAVAFAIFLTGCAVAQPVPAPTRSIISTRPTPPSSAVATPTPVPLWNVPHDSGPRQNATGTVAVSAAGIPVTYTVAPDDNAGAICQRLGVRWWQLQTTDGQFLGTYPTIYPGEVINIVEVYQPFDISDHNPLC